MSLPPDLRVLCQQLTNSKIPTARLIQALPALTNHVLQCGDALSAPQDQKIRTSAPESSVLVHKLKTSITTLLNDRDPQRRFVGVALVKAIVDVGGWECLNGSEPWARGLLSVIQKKDPLSSKELAIVALTRIYTLTHGGQTLVRSITTPTLPSFATACLQLLKPSPSEKLLRTPLPVVETICDALAATIPLFPATLRPFTSQIRTAIHPYIAPTLTDELVIPQSLQTACRKLAITLHFTAQKKDGAADEWHRLIVPIVALFHRSANQVFRAVHETWEPPPKYRSSRVDFDREPFCDEEDASNGYPRWIGITAGSQRLVGFLGFMTDFLRYPTDAQVTIPVGEMMDAVSRVVQIARHSSKTQTWEQALEINPSVSRDERDELWSAMPGIHVAALELVLVICQRLERNFIPLAPEALDYVVRVFKSGISSASIRSTSYRLLAHLLPLTGPTLPKETVATLDLLISGCCRDLQQHSGILTVVTKTLEAKKNGVAMNINADLFLDQKSDEKSMAPSLDAAHVSSAESLLRALLEYLPQRHLKPALRGLMDQTAVVTGNKEAMLASVLNPFRNKQGKMYSSLLPFLTRQFPNDQGLEILRTNMRMGYGGNVLNSSLAVHQEEEEEEEEEEEGEVGDDDIVMHEENGAETVGEAGKMGVSSAKAGARALEPVAQEEDMDEVPKPNPFEPRTLEEMVADEVEFHAQAQSTKRKLQDESEQPSKRLDTGHTPASLPSAKPAQPRKDIRDDDSDEDEDVPLVASFDSDEDE